MRVGRKLLLIGFIVCSIAAIGVGAYFVVRSADSHQIEVAGAGSSNSQVTLCQDFLVNQGPTGWNSVVSSGSAVTVQAIRSYLLASQTPDATPFTITSIRYYDCGQRTYDNVELTGTFPHSCPAEATSCVASYKYILIDAKTGQVLRVELSPTEETWGGL